MQDLLLFIVDLVVVAVLAGVLLAARRSIARPGLKDVLGISATFVILCGVGFLMIVGEHALG
ncbi:MAG: hypothetical protein QOK05_2550 [Chloroflexota bacterium]|jgi:hypothetical protein|nr:hypothetical protein [Chloroflexota bacterium]